MSSLCLVTGACGFMGSHMVEVLHEAGYPVRATDLRTAYEKEDRERGRFPSVLKRLGVEFFPADLKQDPLAKVVQGVGFVFHIAGIFDYSAPWDLLYRVNVVGTKNLLEALQETPSFRKIVVWGAGGIYRFPNDPKDPPLTEASPIDPNNDYLKSKWEEERLVASFCKEKRLRWSSIRPTTVYGPRGLYGGGKLFLDGLKMKTVRVPRNFTFLMPTVHVRDVCRAALFLMEDQKSDGEAFNLNDDSQTKVIDFMRMLAEANGRSFQLLPPIPMALLKPSLYLVAALGKWRRKLFGGKPPQYEKASLKYFGIDFTYSNKKLKETGFQFEYPKFEAGLKQTVAWYKEQGWI